MACRVLAVALLAFSLLGSVCCSQYPVLQHDYVNDRTPFEQVRGAPYNVTFNGRAVAINGQNVLLQSGSIHYPRSTPEMWPHLMQNSRDGGLNTIQVYVSAHHHRTPHHALQGHTQPPLLPLTP